MSIQIYSIIGLVLIFLLATLRSVNMGAIAFLGAFVLSTFVVGKARTSCSPDSPAICSSSSSA